MKVYKYRAYTKRNIKALKNNQLYAASIASLNDIQEAKYLIDNQQFNLIDAILPNSKHKPTKILNSFIETAKDFGIFSLSKTYNSNLLWAHYANSHNGFCIEYDIEMLKQYPLKTEAFLDVLYEKNIPIVNIKDFTDEKILVQKLFATKSIDWQYEEEFRIITGRQGFYSHYSMAIKSIYFGYKINERSIKLIMRLLRGRKIKYYKMIHNKTKYELEKIEIKDIYHSYSIYSDKTNKFIPEFDEKLKLYKDLIIKAIIIVEQECMCKEIIYVDLSSKSTKDNPIFYVTYEDVRQAGSAINYFISKREIEKIFLHN